MEALELIPEDSEILRIPALPWDFEAADNAWILAEGLRRVMFRYNGLGLAAPQVGIPFRVFVMHDPDTNTTEDCFNPKILERSGFLVQETEGCLSFPNLLLDIERNSNILVQYSNSEGKLFEKELTGRQARVFQHELDHVDGICFDRHVSRLALNIAQRKRAKATRRKSNVE